MRQKIIVQLDANHYEVQDLPNNVVMVIPVGDGLPISIGPTGADLLAGLIKKVKYGQSVRVAGKAIKKRSV